MSYSRACCTIPPVDSNYTPKGKFENIGDLPVYTVGPSDAKKAIIVIYDIFGLHKNTQQFCDVLAEHRGYKVLLPDFFRGDAWNQSLGNTEAIVAWLGKVGTFDVIAPQLEQVRESLQAQGVTTAGLVGFCWGAKIAVLATAVDSFFGAASLVHPSLVDIKDAENAKAPILALPSKDEPDMTAYMEVLYKKSFGSQCKHQRFDDMAHGFCGGRADWSDELNKKRATEVIQLTVNFFDETLKA
ncbi:hypothetical protein DFQ28_008198 [Apophysomyces sp. BC1034]|nr:hypothetical protein DFQ30_007714 [Apophysomyces sp. BC1015]KAG0181971.1 hypothetical protein DFQ29_006368 [Apophysomyces sp. BC1021]KAG0192691.1 hypothetical protein DFQ28_008198 [Apophysomyces sp. BC1034]